MSIFKTETLEKQMLSVFVKDVNSLSKSINDYTSAIAKSECTFMRNFGGSSKVIYNGEAIIVSNRYIFGNYLFLKEGEKVFVNNKASSVFNNL